MQRVIWAADGCIAAVLCPDVCTSKWSRVDKKRVTEQLAAMPSREQLVILSVFYEGQTIPQTACGIGCKEAEVFWILYDFLVGRSDSPGETSPVPISAIYNLLRGAMEREQIPSPSVLRVRLRLEALNQREP